jgi:hypothetical protein
MRQKVYKILKESKILRLYLLLLIVNALVFSIIRLSGAFAGDNILAGFLILFPIGILFLSVEILSIYFIILSVRKKYPLQFFFLPLIELGVSYLILFESYHIQNLLEGIVSLIFQTSFNYAILFEFIIRLLQIGWGN